MNRRNFGRASLAVMLSGMGAHRVAQAAIPPGYVNVKAFGAKGDGRVDDSAAVQRAMQAGAAVWFPAGVYIVGNLKLKDGQTLAGEGRGSVLRQRIGAAYGVSANPGGEGYADPALNLSGISVLDLRFEGPAGQVAFDEHVHLLNLNGVSSVCVAGCEFVGYVGDGIYLGSGNLAGIERHNDNVLIRDCLFDGVVKNNRNGISIIDGTDITIDRCRFVRSGRPDMPGAIDIEPDGSNDAFSRIRNIRISRCTFSDIGAGALISVLLRPNDRLAMPASDIEISDCTGDGNGQANQSALAITQNSWSSRDDPSASTPPLGLVVKNSRFANVYRPFAMTATKGVRFENVSFVQSAAFAFLGSGDDTQRNVDVMLRSCSFKRIGTSSAVGVAGLRIYGNDRVTLEGCRFEDCGAADGSGGFALNFAGSCRSSQVSLLDTTVISTAGLTTYAIRVYPSHRLAPPTNRQAGTRLIGVAGNDFLSAV